MLVASPKRGRAALSGPALVFANLATRHVVEPADRTAVGPIALLSIHRVCAQALVAGRPVAPLSFGDTSLGSDRTCPARRQSRVRALFAHPSLVRGRSAPRRPRRGGPEHLGQRSACASGQLIAGSRDVPAGSSCVPTRRPASPCASCEPAFRGPLTWSLSSFTRASLAPAARTGPPRKDSAGGGPCAGAIGVIPPPEYRWRRLSRTLQRAGSCACPRGEAPETRNTGRGEAPETRNTGQRRSSAHDKAPCSGTSPRETTSPSSSTAGMTPGVVSLSESACGHAAGIVSPGA